MEHIERAGVHSGDSIAVYPPQSLSEDIKKKLGLHRSIFGDSVATMLASCIGGPPTTTYGENIGVLAITRVFSVFVIGGAAVIALCFGFIGKISALIRKAKKRNLSGSVSEEIGKIHT